MENLSTSNLAAMLAAAGPLALLLFGLVPSSMLNRNPIRSARIGARISLAVLGLAVGAVVATMQAGPVHATFTLMEPLRLGVYLDNLSVMALALVALLLAVVTRYSVHYLAGDPAQGRFMKWLSLTGCSVLTIIVSGNLIQFALAWCATSLCLHQLLVFYPDRPGAILAARKKFIISRLGDLCLLAAILLIYQTFHTLEFAELLEITRNIHQSPTSSQPIAIQAIGFLLIAVAMLKSAQFPFHSWLPDTMETPTPVSALMHAGIINAGGFLIIRLNPLLTLSPQALSTLALFGAFTALFASLVMLTHASVKRSLAFSTVAQMGFMMLECGLGAFGLAMLHLVAHSLYKAHAFLSSGNLALASRRSWVPTAQPNAHPFSLVAAFGTAFAITGGCAWLFGVHSLEHRSVLVLGCIFAMGLGYALWNLWSHSRNLKTAAFGTASAAGLAFLYLSLERFFVVFLGEKPWDNAHLNSWPGLILVAALLCLFLFVLIVQTELPQWKTRPWFQAAYVHARNGFYFNTLANRAVAALWPIKSSQNSKHQP